MFVYKINVLFFYRINQYMWIVENDETQNICDGDKNCNKSDSFYKYFKNNTIF